MEGRNNQMLLTKFGPDNQIHNSNVNQLPTKYLVTTTKFN